MELKGLRIVNCIKAYVSEYIAKYPPNGNLKIVHPPNPKNCTSLAV